MAMYRTDPHQNMEDTTCTALSGYNSACVSSSSQVQISDALPQESVFDVLVQETNELGIKLNSLVEYCSKYKSSNKRPSLSEDSSEILKKKVHFLENLTLAVENSDPIGVPKYKIHCYQQLSSLITKRFNECEQSKYQIEKQVKKQKSESDALSSQIKVFSNLIGDQLNYQEAEESRTLFQEAKKDMDTVLRTLFPSEVKNELERILMVLIEGYMNNLDYEDQFVEITTDNLYNEGLQYLVKGSLAIHHPLFPTRLRLSIS